MFKCNAGRHTHEDEAHANKNKHSSQYQYTSKTQFGMRYCSRDSQI